MATLWNKGTSASEAVEKFTVGADRELDLRLAKFDVIGSKAHSRMLESIGLLEKQELEALLKELDSILSDIEQGKFRLEEGVEDIHSQVELLLTREQIASRVKEMGRQITKDFQGKDLTVICILKGAVVFFVDLVREIDLPMTMDFMAISSYGSATKSSGVVRILKDLDKPVNGRDVLIIEDIVDSGMTLSFLKENLLSRGAASLHIATLLDKPERRRVPLHVDYVGFTIPDEFVVGYGLDYAERYRNLPDIGILKPEVYEK